MTTISENIIYRRVAPLLLVCTFVLAIGAVVGTYVNDRNDRERAREQIAVNTANAVTTCQNANETREASRTLWNFVLDLSSARNVDATPAEVAYLEEFRDWIDTVYQERDCTDLSRKYPLPPPPALPTAG